MPFREPLSSTCIRTGLIAAGIGTVSGLSARQFPVAIAVAAGALWFSFAGHWVEMLWLDGIRERLPRDRVLQFGARLAYWFLCGAVLGVPMVLTINAMLGSSTRMIDPVGSGFAFVMVELFVHAVLLARAKRPSVYDGRG